MIQFEILRPWAFLFLIPLLGLCLFQNRILHMWRGVIDERLVNELLVKQTNKRNASSILFALSLFCSVIAMAGIQFREIDVSLYKPKTPVVLLLDLSLSMRAKDVSPNRFNAAVFKTYDLLKALNGYPVGLVVFSNEPYIIAPTTTDSSVIEKHMPLMNFNLMPAQGTVLHRAIDEAARLIRTTGAENGDIFLLSDGGEEREDLDERTVQAAERLAKNGGRLFVLGIGTREGGVLTDRNDKLITDELNAPVRHQLRDEFLKNLASIGKGAYASVSPSSNEDIQFLLEVQKRIYVQTQKTDYTGKTVLDEGFWFLLPLLILFPVFFVQGRLGVIAFLLCLPAFPAKATVSFADLFTSSYDKIMRRIDNREFQEAQQEALKTKDFDVIYNIGTTFIHKGKYKNAVDVLTVAVSLNPENENAAVNLEIAQKLLKQEEQGNGGDSGFGGKDGQNKERSGESGDSDNGEREEIIPEGEDEAEPDEKEGEGKSENKKGEQNKSNRKETEKESKTGADTQSGSKQKGDAKQTEETDKNQNDGRKTSDNDSSGNSTERQKENQNDSTPDGEGKPLDNTLKRIQEDPAALLKHKINTLYNSKRYENDGTQGVPPW